MAVQTEVTIVTLEGRLVAPGIPLLHADDLAVLRGDGVFETLLVRDGAACLLDAHLRRLAHSAELMELPTPDLPAWARAVDMAVQHWTSGSTGEGALRLIYSRGRESGSEPTGYVMISPLPDRIAAARRDGVAAVTLDRGLSATGGDAMPWLLAGAKTLSYAVNMAALRYAAQRGADDVIFVSSDGYILEGPRSTVVIVQNAADNTCLFTPPPSHRILHGTTQQALFDVAKAHGYDCDYRPLRRTDLFAAHDVWLGSSITLAARVHTLDGRVLAPGSPDAEVVELIEAAVVSDRRRC
ncbi:MAG TPA: aminodeoxychorismate lyase [Mycobacterium sp.]|nr:aminodeoxychorismate lyase [Mycobacterium sp.]